MGQTCHTWLGSGVGLGLGLGSGLELGLGLELGVGLGLGLGLGVGLEHLGRLVALGFDVSHPLLHGQLPRAVDVRL